jgi:cellulose synthase (UDP-forming)
MTGTHEIPPRVEAYSPLTLRDRVLFIVLSGVAALALWGYFAFVPWHDPADHALVKALFVGLVLFYVGSWTARWFALWRIRRPRHMEPPPGLRVAAVTTFVPAAESVDMLEQTLRGLVGMHGAHDTWVLDEGDDERVARLCDSLGVRHWSRQHSPEYRRPDGPFAQDTKYGNYNAWLAAVGYDRYDIIAAFDSDHIAEPNYLQRVLGYFRDPAVGFVQAPQVYYNQSASFIARGAAEETYAFYSIHQMASYGAGHPIIVGCHNTHRLTALREVGGFSQHDADDLVLTLLYRAAGWRGVYVPEILALGLTPVNWYDYLRQQVRWSRSVVEIKLRRLPALVGRLSVTDRLLGLLHGVYYLRSLSLAFIYGLVAWVLLAGQRPAFTRPWALLGLAVLVLVTSLVSRFTRRFYLDPRREGGVHWRATVLQFAKWPYQWLAVLRAFGRQPARYALTHKLPRPPRRILWPHAAIAVVVATTVALGAWWYGYFPGVSSLALLLVAVLVALVATEHRQFPAPWEPHRYAARRGQMSDILGPAPWRGPERRRNMPRPADLPLAVERRRPMPVHPMADRA